MPPVRIVAGRATLLGDLTVPPDPSAIIVFAHGSGSSRTSSRNRTVAQGLVDAGFATLLFDLLTEGEERAERVTRHLRFDISLLATRLIETLDWLAQRSEVGGLPVGLFGASTGAAAAMMAAAKVKTVGAVVSRGGRPDLAAGVLSQVRAPTLLIVGGEDVEVLALNRLAMTRMTAPAALQVIASAGHLFEEPGTLREVTESATRWFRKYLARPARSEPVVHR